jgi:hypothetical protein
MKFEKINIIVSHKDKRAEVWQYENNLAEVRIKYNGEMTNYVFKHPRTLTKTLAILVFKKILSLNKS